MQRLTMATLLLIPLEDTVVFPTMDVTLPVDVGDEERVLLVPRHVRARRAGRHHRLLARSDLRAEARRPAGARRHRAPREGAGPPARAPGRAAGAPQDPRRR